MEYTHYIAVDWSIENMAIARMTAKSNKVTVIDVAADISELKLYLDNLQGSKIMALEETTTALAGIPITRNAEPAGSGGLRLIGQIETPPLYRTEFPRAVAEGLSSLLGGGRHPYQTLPAGLEDFYIGGRLDGVFPFTKGEVRTPADIEFRADSLRLNAVAEAMQGALARVEARIK